jgi:hypothetical protein
MVPLTALGENIKPFDRLGKDNVTLRAQHISGGSSRDYSYKISWGSYVRMVKSFKDIEVTIVEPRTEKHALMLEFFFVIKGDRRYAKRAGEADFPEGEGSAVFSTSPRQSQRRFVFVGTYAQSGEKVEGWLVRALKGGQIVGVAASAPRLEETAGNPERLNALVASSPLSAQSVSTETVKCRALSIKESLDVGLATISCFPLNSGKWGFVLRVRILRRAAGESVQLPRSI